MGAFRNVMTHTYLGIKPERVWETIVRDLPPLEREAAIIIRGLPPTTPDLPKGGRRTVAGWRKPGGRERGVCC